MDEGILAGNQASRKRRCSIPTGNEGYQWKCANDTRKGGDNTAPRRTFTLQGIALGPRKCMKSDFTY
jgi:hypothetical protein